MIVQYLLIWILSLLTDLQYLFSRLHKYILTSLRNNSGSKSLSEMQRKSISLIHIIVSG